MPAAPPRPDDRLIAAKRTLREAARARRQALAAAGAGAGAAALAHLLASGWLEGRARVSAYWPMGEEFDCRPILEALDRRGHACLLPTVAGRRRPLVFRRWRPGAPLLEEGFGVLRPDDTAPVERPDLLLVPLLAFDPDGYRLGYGGGYYDLSLRVLRTDGGPRPLAVGLAFAGQEVEAVPHGPGDERLDAMLSEAGTRRFAGAGERGS